MGLKKKKKSAKMRNLTGIGTEENYQKANKELRGEETVWV